MPNWAHNTIQIEAKKDRKQEVIESLEKLTLNENREFTFKKLLPQPKDLMLVVSSNLDLAKRYIEAIKSGDKKTAKDIKEFFLNKGSEVVVEDLYIDTLNTTKTPLTEKDFETYIEKIKSNISTYGYADWYDWSLENWGTKWDACGAIYNVDDNVVTIMFDTAWSAPFPVIQKIYDKMVERLGNNENGKVFKFYHCCEDEGCVGYGVRNYECESDYSFE